jgi:hypothetical protein
MMRSLAAGAPASADTAPRAGKTPILLAVENRDRAVGFAAAVVLPNGLNQDAIPAFARYHLAEPCRRWPAWLSATRTGHGVVTQGALDHSMG